MKGAPLPAGWLKSGHDLWFNGDKSGAIQSVLGALNDHLDVKPAPLILQLAYYIFLSGDPGSAAQFLELGVTLHPDNTEILLNAGVCHSRSGNAALAIRRFQELLSRDPQNFVALDGLCAALARQRDYAAARKAGTDALIAKDTLSRARQTAKSVNLARTSHVIGNRVIAFSLFGTQPRYLRGAIDNMLAARQFYPGWAVRFYLDQTVPKGVQDALDALGAELVLEPPNQSLRERLAWRFKVADDVSVSHFLVRDVDARLNEREARAVEKWLESGKKVHVMRDWWTHTDLMLAGMWGGTQGALPPIWPLLTRYQSKAMETANIDQWFLRDEIWPIIHKDVLVHDRCFDMPNTSRWPDPDPEGNFHVGQDEYAVRRDDQAARIAQWINTLPELA